MITLLASLLGFISSMVPSLIKIWQDKQDKKHELAILQLQLTADANKSRSRLEAILAHTDLESTKVLYKTYNTGITWVDSLNGVVRPALTFGLFGAYIMEKVLIGPSWLEEDQALFCSIITFYFGTRYNYRLANGNGYFNGNGNGYSNGNGNNGKY